MEELEPMPVSVEPMEELEPMEEEEEEEEEEEHLLAQYLVFSCSFLAVEGHRSKPCLILERTLSFHRI
jgi:hypothetical protein